MATQEKHLYPDHAQTVLRVLNHQRREGHHLCDITIHVQNHIFWAHKCVLCGSSGYFAAILSSSSASNKVELPGLTPQGVGVVLDFIYTSELNLSIENALETNNAANFLQVMDILNNCSSFLAAALRPPPEASGTRNVHSTSSDVGNRQSSSVSSPIGSISPSSGSQDDSRGKFGCPVLSTMLQDMTAKGPTSSTLHTGETLDHQHSVQSDSRPGSGQSDITNTRSTPRIQHIDSSEPNRQAVLHVTSKWSPGLTDNRELTFEMGRLPEKDRNSSSRARSATVVKLENEDNEVTSCSHETETGNRNSEQRQQQSSLQTKRFKASSESPSARFSLGLEGNHGDRLTSQEDMMGSLVLSCTSDSTAILDEVEGDSLEINPQPKMEETDAVPGPHDLIGGNQHLVLQATAGTSRDQTNMMLVLCDECGAPFSSQAALQQHRLSVHSSLQPFKCHVCPAAFRRSYELDRHLVSHSQNLTMHGASGVPSAMLAGTSFMEPLELLDRDKPFRCEICQISFKTKSNLAQHTLFRHTEERPFKCELCQAGFKRNFELNRHMNTHNRRKDTEPSHSQ